MCGINGIIDFTFKYKDNMNSIISKMNQSIIHRGPDDEGLYIKDNIALGMRRLSIIDLETGGQPIFNEDRTQVIFFNGEIYNYKLLKKELENRGHIFLTTGDTEVILHCFEEYGLKSFDKLSGMYSIAIFDLQKKQLTIARDRAGEKPLYYYFNEEVFIFASELKSIMSTGILKKNINKKALNQYLQLTYIPAPLTIFENVYKLLPGHYIQVSLNRKFTMEKYWDVVYRDDELVLNYNKCKQILREKMFYAVEECMVADVPIGTFLSGGIDSTIITGIASKISDKPINTFTIGFREKEYDESSRAKLACEFHKTIHHVFYLNYEDVLPELDKILNNIDEPFADSAYIPTYMVSKNAGKFVKTVLTGDAGDELFGGYEKYLIRYYAEKYNKIPKWIREDIIRNTVYKLPDVTTMTRKLRKVIDNFDKSVFEQRKNLMCLGFKGEEISLLLNEKYIDFDSLDMIKNFYTAQYATENEISKTLYTDFKVILEGDMLTKVDRASMLNSLETRVPMLHKDVVEFASKIPSQFKINGRNKKIILKDTFSDLIPKQLLSASKRGFGVPVGNWFRNELKSELLELLSREVIEAQGVFQYEYIKKILEEHFMGKRNRASELWILYVFQKWLVRLDDL